MTKAIEETDFLEYDSEFSEDADFEGQAFPERFEQIDKLRFFLIALTCINLLGFPFFFGDIVQALCGFTAPAFFILSGFLILREKKGRAEKILRTIKKTALCFLILAISYFLINFIYGKISGADIFAGLTAKSIFVDFLILNIWPFAFGESIWYIQAILYAYIILYFLEKLNLLRFDWLIMILCLVFTLISGEFSSLFGFELFGHGYLSGNYLTRAIPYLLMGCFIGRKAEIFQRIPPLVYGMLAVLGAFMIILEYVWIRDSASMSYFGHLLGMILFAPCFCMKTLLQPGGDYLSLFSAVYISKSTNIIYYFIPLVHLLLVLISGVIVNNSELFLSLYGILCFGICALGTLVYCGIFYATQISDRYAEPEEEDDYF